MIYFLGDVHGRIDHVLPALSARQEMAAHAIFLGDIDSTQPFEEEIRHLIADGIRVWFIHGNHDTDNWKIWDNLQRSNDRTLRGRVVEIDGIRVAGMNLSKALKMRLNPCQQFFQILTSDWLNKRRISWSPMKHRRATHTDSRR